MIISLKGYIMIWMLDTCFNKDGCVFAKIKDGCVLYRGRRLNLFFWKRSGIGRSKDLPRIKGQSLNRISNRWLWVIGLKSACRTMNTSLTSSYGWRMCLGATRRSQCITCCAWDCWDRLRRRASGGASWPPLPCKILLGTQCNILWTSDWRVGHGLQDEPSACFTCL